MAKILSVSKKVLDKSVESSRANAVTDTKPYRAKRKRKTLSPHRSRFPRSSCCAERDNPDLPGVDTGWEVVRHSVESSDPLN